jgi:hypothetical protein
VGELPKGLNSKLGRRNSWERRFTMADETRRLLKVFGVAVTDFEAEAEKLEAAATRLTAASGKDQIAKLLKDATELCRELNTRWLETTQHIFATQNRLLSRLAEAAARLQVVDTTEIESARMEAHE